MWNRRCCLVLELMGPASYPVRMSASPVYELALDIAAYTRDDIHDKLAQGVDGISAVRRRLSPPLQDAVRLAGEVHSWRSLLMLAHRGALPTLADADVDRIMTSFMDWMAGCGETLPTLAAPYLGPAWEGPLQAALAGDAAALEHIVAAHTNNPVVTHNVRYLATVPAETITGHLIALVEGWYREVCPIRGGVWEALQQDWHHKESRVGAMATSEFVRWATDGQEFVPPPGTEQVWMVPQVTYRPFTIANFLPRCVVYYYPVAPEFLPGHAIESRIQTMAAGYKALGDAHRLQLLRVLRDSPQSLAQLTERLGATKSNVHHHLTLLRTAGLVRVDQGVYAWQPEAVRIVGDDLRALLGIEP